VRSLFRRGVVVLALVASWCGACGSFDGAPRDAGAPSDAAGDEGRSELDGASDGGSDAPADHSLDTDADALAPCTTEMSFGAVVELVDLGEATSARLTRDGTTAFVSAETAGNQDDVYEGPFPKGGALYAHVVDSPDLEMHPAPVAGDPKRLFYEHGTAGGAEVVEATRSQVGQKFGAPTAVPIARDAGIGTREPYALGDGSILYFTMQPGAAGGRDVFRAARDGGAPWSVALVAGLSAGLAGHPVPSDDELVLYFSRGPAGLPADVWYATRADKNAPFSGALPVEGINDGTADDRPTWLSADQCTLLFTSNRSGAYRVYRASRR
jgi:hypothetical protein